MNRKSLYLSTVLRRRGPARLRLLKDDNAGGATGGGDNGGSVPAGNSGDSRNTGGDSNNTSDQFDPVAFWNGPAPANGGSGSGESAANNPSNSESDTQGGGNDLNTQLATQLQNMSFGEPVFTPEIQQQIQEGNFDGVQDRFNSMMQQGVRQALAMQVQILRPFAEQMMNQMREEFGSTLNNRDNTDQLVKDFPAAKDPRVAPAIKNIFDQAIKNTGGDRVKAVAQTKQMMALMANVTSGDLDLRVAPRGSEDFGGPQQPVTNWLDELTVR